MSASFFSLKLPPLPSALCHPEVLSFSRPPSWGPQLCPQALLSSPPQSLVHSAPDTSTTPVPLLLCRARFSPVSSTQSSQYPCNDSSPATSSYRCQSPCSETQTTSFLFKALCPWRPTLPVHLQVQPLRPGSLPSSLWLPKPARGFMALCLLCPGPHLVCLKIQSKAASSLQLSSDPSTSWKCQWLCLLRFQDTRDLLCLP